MAESVQKSADPQHSDKAQSIGIEKMTQTILAYLLREGQAATEKQIAESISGRRQNKLAALRLLLIRDEIVRLGLGSRVDPYRYEIKRSVPLLVDNVIAREPTPVAVNPEPLVERPRNTQSEVYREYKLAGEEEPLQVTKEEFDNVVDVFRMLLNQDFKMRQNKRAS